MLKNLLSVTKLTRILWSLFCFDLTLEFSIYPKLFIRIEKGNNI